MEKITLRKIKKNYAVTEAFRSIKTNLRFCGKDKKVIAVTSCTPGEGKSCVSMHLAMSLAEDGLKVLLIDADLRKSVMRLRFVAQTGEIHGLTHYLSEQCSLTDAVCVTDIPDLSMIVSGPVPPNPPELLRTRKFQELLATARKVYDYVLIDTPPLGSVIDSAVIAEFCDGAIMVIANGAISYRFAQENKKQLEKSNCPVLGAILNKVNGRSGAYGKYYGKYYGRDAEKTNFKRTAGL